MTILSGISDQPKQQMTIVLDDGSKATLFLEYVNQQLGWFYNLSSGNFTTNGMRLVASPNMLRQFRNQINFGLACLTQGYVEPTQQTNFIDGTITLVLLNAIDVAAVEAQIYTA